MGSTESVQYIDLCEITEEGKFQRFLELSERAAAGWAASPAAGSVRRALAGLQILQKTNLAYRILFQNPGNEKISEYNFGGLVLSWIEADFCNRKTQSNTFILHNPFDSILSKLINTYQISANIWQFLLNFTKIDSSFLRTSYVDFLIYFHILVHIFAIIPSVAIYAIFSIILI